MRAALRCAVWGLALWVTYPRMLRAQQDLLKAVRNCPVFFAHPRLVDLKSYAAMVPPFSLPLAGLAAVAWIVKFDRMGQQQTRPMQQPATEDMVIAWTLSAFLPLMHVITHFGTGFFQPRYGIGSAIGLAMLAGMLPGWIGRRHGSRWRYAASVAWVGSLYGFAIATVMLWYAPHLEVGTSWNDPVLHAGPPQDPIVIASSLEFSPLWWYSDSETRARLHNLKDLGYAGKYINPISDYSLAIEYKYTPMQLDNYEEFLAIHPHFLLYCTGEPMVEWIKPRLINEGWRLKLLQSGKLRQAEGEGPQRTEPFEVSR
jgi:hypothetical protein